MTAEVELLQHGTAQKLIRLGAQHARGSANETTMQGERHVLTCMELHGNRVQQSTLLPAQHAGQGRRVKGGGSLQRRSLQDSCCHQLSAQRAQMALLAVPQ